MPDLGINSSVTNVNGDTAFISKKKFDGKRVSSYGSGGGTAVLASYIPAVGKTFYLSNAQYSAYGANNATETSLGELRNNGTVIEAIVARADTSRYNTLGAVEFRSKGDSLDGDGIKAFDVRSVLDASGLGKAMLEGFIEDTGIDPTV